jgi:hypothetical protein
MLNVGSFRSCWSLWSTVRKTSSSRSASWSYSALRWLAHPTSGAVRASQPSQVGVSRRGRISSSKTRTGQEGGFRLLARGDGLCLRHGRNVLDKLDTAGPLRGRRAGSESATHVPTKTSARLMIAVSLWTTGFFCIWSGNHPLRAGCESYATAVAVAPELILRERWHASRLPSVPSALRGLDPRQPLPV